MDQPAVETVATPEFETRLVKYDITREQIAQKRQEYSALPAIVDRQSYEANRLARSDLRNARSKIEERRKQLNADAVQWTRIVNTEAKALTAEIKSIEDPIAASLNAFDDAKEAEKVAEAEARRQQLEAQLRAEQEKENQRRLEDERKRQQALAAEEERVAKLRAENEERQRQLEEQRRAVEAQQRQLEEQRKAFEAEQRRQIEAEQKAAQQAREKRYGLLACICTTIIPGYSADDLWAKRKNHNMIDIDDEVAEPYASMSIAELESLLAEVQSKTKKELEEKARKHDEEIRVAELERQENLRKRLEALKPDREKLFGYGVALMAVPIPELTDPEAQSFAQSVFEQVEGLAELLNNWEGN